MIGENFLIPPDLLVFVDERVRAGLARTNCHQIGVVEAFNPTKQTATIQLKLLVKPNDTDTEQPPLLTDVPVFMLCGGDRGVTFPVRPGDTCLVLFNDTDLDNWFFTGQSRLPNSERTHDLSDGMAIVGFRSGLNPISSFSETDVEMRNGVGRISLGDKILVKNADTDLRQVLLAIKSALDLLNSVKVGGDASGQIVVANTLIENLLKS